MLDFPTESCTILHFGAFVALFLDISSERPDSAPVSGQEFLAGLGSRVRELRHRRGITRKQLAEGSEVSERHLAQLECGEGNISILLLRRVANVLNIGLGELFENEKRESTGKDSITRFFERLPLDR